MRFKNMKKFIISLKLIFLSIGLFCSLINPVSAELFPELIINNQKLEPIEKIIAKNNTYYFSINELSDKLGLEITGDRYSGDFKGAFRINSKDKCVLISQNSKNILIVNISPENFEIKNKNSGNFKYSMVTLQSPILNINNKIFLPIELLKYLNFDVNAMDKIQINGIISNNIKDEINLNLEAIKTVKKYDNLIIDYQKNIDILLNELTYHNEKENNLKHFINKQIRVKGNWTIKDYQTNKVTYILNSEPIKVLSLKNSTLEHKFIGLYKTKKYLFPLAIIDSWNYFDYKVYNWSQSIWTDIKNQEICRGMTKDMAILSWGEPNDINRSVGSWGVQEQWCYENSYLYFENGRLTSWQN